MRVNEDGRPPPPVTIGAGLQALLAVLSVPVALGRFAYNTGEGVFLLVTGTILLGCAVGLVVPQASRRAYALSIGLLLVLVVMWLAIMIYGALVLRESWRVVGLLRFMWLPLALIVAPLLTFLAFPSSRRWAGSRKSEVQSN